MSTDAYQEIMAAFDQGALDRIERELGVEGKKTREATGAAVGTILEGLRRKAEQQKQETPSRSAVEDMLDKWGLGTQAEAPEPRQIDPKQVDPKQVDPKQVEDVFGDIFGQQGKQDVERRFGKAIKLDPAAVKKIFGAVLPIILGALAKSRQAAPQQEGGGGGGFSLDDILGKARQDFDKQAAPQTQKKPGGGFLEMILDKDKDGDVDLGDLASIFLNKR